MALGVVAYAGDVCEDGYAATRGVGDLLIYVPCTCYNSCAASVNSVLDRIDLSCRPASNIAFFSS